MSSPTKTASTSGVKDLEEVVEMGIGEASAAQDEGSGITTEMFNKVSKDGKDVFNCTVCGYEGTQVGNVKKHIALKHMQKPGSRKRQHTGDGDKTVEKKPKQDEDGLNETLMKEWEDGKFATSTQAVGDDPDNILNLFDEDGKPLDNDGEPLYSDETLKNLNSSMEMSDMNMTVRPGNKAEEGSDITLKEQLKALQDEVNTKNENIEKLKKDYETTDDLYVKAMGRISELENEVIEKDKKIMKFNKIATTLNEENKKLKAGKMDKTDKELKEKLKTANTAIKEKDKEIVETNQRINELAGKVASETTARAKAEAEVTRVNKLCDYLQESLDRAQNKTGNEKSKEKIDKICFNIEKYGKCRFKEDCRFTHPEKICEFFVKVGKCPFENKCKDLHSKTDRDAFVNGGKGSGNKESNTKDCKWWLLGNCRAPAGKECNRGLHNADKFATAKDSFLEKGHPTRWREKSGVSGPNQSDAGMTTPAMSPMIPNHMLANNTMPSQMMTPNLMPGQMMLVPSQMMAAPGQMMAAAPNQMMMAPSQMMTAFPPPRQMTPSNSVPNQMMASSGVPGQMLEAGGMVTMMPVNQFNSSMEGNRK